jgi:hypothetical protein
MRLTAVVLLFSNNALKPHCLMFARKIDVLDSFISVRSLRVDQAENRFVVTGSWKL